VCFCLCFLFLCLCLFVCFCLLGIKLYYLNNFQCSHIIENNLATIGYLDRNNYQKSVIINQSDLTRYLRKIIKVMIGHPNANKMTYKDTARWPKERNFYMSRSRGSSCLILQRVGYDCINIQ
jgi:hypothetical protein